MHINLRGIKVIRIPYHLCAYSQYNDSLLLSSKTKVPLKVLIHELAHLTAHPSRLNRVTAKFDEELVAELSASLLSQDKHSFSMLICSADLDVILHVVKICKFLTKNKIVNF